MGHKRQRFAAKTLARCAVGVCLAAGASIASAQDVSLVAPDADETLTTALRAASLTLTLERDGAETAQDYVAAARADYQRLLTGLYSAGYYSGTISILVDGVEASQINPLVGRASVGSVVLSVTPGPRFTFGRAEIAPLARGTTLPDTFANGEIARSGVIGDAAGEAIDGWRAQGRPLARTTDQSITARHPDRALDVTVVVDPGPELTFGLPKVEGNAAVRTDRILEIAGLTNGIYDPEDVTRAQTNLRRTGTFSSAAIIEGEAADGSTLPMTISVVEQIPRRIGFGAEFSSVSGLTLSSYWLHRNFLGGAERFRVDGEITGLSGGTGGVDYSLGVAFLRPATFSQRNDLYINANLTQLDEPTFFERDFSIEAGIIRRLDDAREIRAGVGFATGEVSDDLGDRTYSLLYLPLEGTLDRRDDAFNAKSGYYANIAVTPFVGTTGSVGGVRFFGDGRVFRSFGQDGRVTLAARAQVGSVLGADAADVPASYLFYSGGGGTVRGQPYQSLAIDLGGGNDIGGTAFFGAQLEARVDVTDTIGVVGFYDTGFVGADDTPFNNGEWHAGAGLGLRYNTGIGPIRLDLATPVTGDNAGGALEVYIGIGQAF